MGSGRFFSKAEMSFIIPGILVTITLMSAVALIPSVFAVNSIEIKATLKKGDYVETNRWFPEKNSTIIFGDTNKLCPKNDCKYEFQDVTFNKFGANDRILSGTLKLEDKKNSDGNFTSYNYYKMSASLNLITSKENAQTGTKIFSYKGDLGIDTDDAIFTPAYKYASTATLTEPDNSFELKGTSK